MDIPDNISQEMSKYVRQFLWMNSDIHEKVMLLKHEQEFTYIKNSRMLGCVEY
jgi:hypothetical protein